MFKRVLFTVDGSKTALGAMSALLRAIDPAQTEITVLEVIDSVEAMLVHTSPAGFPMYADGVVSVDLAEQAVAAQRSEADQHVASAASDLAEAGAQHVATEVREGRPGDEIVGFAQECQAELVVMATHGRSGLRRTVLGSVADHVLRHLDDVPLLLVHPSED